MAELRPPPPQMFEFRLASTGSTALSFTNLSGNVGGSWEAEIEAVCLAPPKFAQRSASILLTGMSKLDDPAFLDAKNEAFSLGALTADRNAVEALLHVPASAVPAIMSGVNAKQIQYLAVQVEDRRLRYARVSGFYFEGAAQHGRSG